MAKRIDPVNVVMEFFEKEQPDTARMAFALVKGIVDRRGLLAKRKKPAKAAKSQPQETTQN